MTLPEALTLSAAHLRGGTSPHHYEAAMGDYRLMLTVASGVVLMSCPQGSATTALTLAKQAGFALRGTERLEGATQYALRLKAQGGPRKGAGRKAKAAQDIALPKA